ncbi:MAG: hypothetical protein KF749_03535 [Bacteroidetes bacterium]|nr:hypothetical protein [Bacteroidota bacterium]MCW5897079.1 hypothetical protein [Bacteroidota bacterium]
MPLQISFDSSSALVLIENVELPLTAWDQIYFLCLPLSENIPAKSSGRLSIPWFKFQSVLQSLARIVATEKIAVFYDAYSKELIRQQASDLKELQIALKDKIPPDSKFDQTIFGSVLKRKLTKEQSRDGGNFLDLDMVQISQFLGREKQVPCWRSTQY